MIKNIIFEALIFTLFACGNQPNSNYGGAVNNVDSNETIVQQLYNKNADNLNSINTKTLSSQYVEDDTLNLNYKEFLEYCAKEQISVDLSEWHNNIETDFENNTQYTQYTTFKNDTVYICTKIGTYEDVYQIIKRIIK